MRLLKFPMLTITLSFAIGILMNYFLKPQGSILVLIALVLFVIFAFSFIRAKKQLFQDVFFGLSCYLFVASIGAISHYSHSEINFKNHYSKAITQDKSEIIGTISAILKPNVKYDRFIVDVQRCNGKRVTGKLLLYHLKSDQLVLQMSQKVGIYKEIKTTSQAVNPYQFNYASYLEKQHIHYQVYCNSSTIITLGVTQNFNYYLQQLRDKLQNSFSIHAFSSKQKSIVSALLLGQKSLMDKETVDNYSKAGVIHILAISGLHIGILYFFLAFISKPLEQFKQGKLLKLLFIVTFLWIFALVTGLPASVTRAVTLFTFISIGKHFGQQSNIYNAVAVSALILLVFNPNFIFDVGFQLSYVAVLSILLFQPFFEKFYFSKNKIAIYFVYIILISLVAQIGVLPLSLYYFNQMPLLFLLANIVVIPLASFVLIFGCITLLLNFVFQPLAILFGKLLTYAIDGMNYYIAFIANIENGIIENISFTTAFVFSMYLSIIAFVYWLYNLKWASFRNLVLTLVLFQVVYIFMKWEESNSNELVIFNAKQTLIAIKDNSSLKIITNDTLVNKNTIKDYARGTFSEEIKPNFIQNCISFQDKRLFVIDSFSIYKTKLQPHIILLSQSPKINLKRVIKEIKPKIIVADNSNPFYKIKEWRATCEKEKIPFHATAEKGFYILK